jgi:regulator of sigma E protease
VINFVLALVLFAMILFVWGEERLPVSNMKYGIITDSLATSVGLKDGDLITSVNGQPLVYFNSLKKDIMLSSKASVLGVKRDGKDTVIHLPDGFISKLTKNQLDGFVGPRYPAVVGNDKEVKYVEGKMEKGDRIIAVNGKYFTYIDEYLEAKKDMKDTVITLTLLRNDKDTVFTKVRTDSKTATKLETRDSYEILGSEKKKYGFFESIPAGIHYGVDRLGDYIHGIQLLFTSKEHKVSENLGSVISIGKTFGGEWDWQRFWTMTALFSIILAFMNILPIPALDGGHALFTLYEMITGRKPSDKFMEYAQLVGMVLLLGLMAYALGLDIFRLFK